MQIAVALLAVASCSAAPHAPHIVNGVPVDTPEVQHEKQIHFAAHQRALAGQPANPILYHPQLAWNHAPAHHWESAHAPAHHWAHHGAYHVPNIVNGVPEETPEVKLAKAQHLQKVAEAQSGHSGHYAPSHHWEGAHHWDHHSSHYTGPIHVPHIVNGVPEETPEVKAAKAFHLQKLNEAHSHSAHSAYHGYDDGQYHAHYHH